MAHLELQIVIIAPRQRVWDIISDLEGQERWMVDVHRLDIVSNVKSGVGTTIDLTSEVFKLPVIHDTMDVVTWDEPSEIGIVHRGAFTGTASFRLEEVPGGTIFHWVEDFKPPLGPLGEVAFLLAVGPHLKRLFTRSMENVRKLAEAPWSAIT
jgi:uncharacterized protein YndB with AHSA1/START domain